MIISFLKVWFISYQTLFNAIKYNLSLQMNPNRVLALRTFHFKCLATIRLHIQNRNRIKTICGSAMGAGILGWGGGFRHGMIPFLG
jgi:hypothetical protein